MPVDSPATRAPPVQADLTDDEAEVAMLDRAWADAIPRRDTAFVKRILADDLSVRSIRLGFPCRVEAIFVKVGQTVPGSATM